MTLSEDKGGFKFGKAAMPDQAKADLDQLVEKLKAEPNGAYIEIEGHTDNAGPADLNYKLGLERAEAVKRYLYEQHQVPLHKINVISYGEEKPIAPNKTKDGPRAEPPRRHQGPDLNGRLRIRAHSTRADPLRCGGPGAERRRSSPEWSGGDIRG